MTEPDEVDFNDLIVGLVAALRLEGYTSFGLGRRCEENLVEAARGLARALSQDGLETPFVPRPHPLHGGCAPVRSALAFVQYLRVGLVDVYEGRMRIQVDPAQAAALLEHLPGSMSHYRDAAAVYVRTASMPRLER